MIRFLQGREHQRELHIGEILHLVDDDKIVARARTTTPCMRDEVRIVKLHFRKPAEIALVQIINTRARADRLPPR